MCEIFRLKTQALIGGVVEVIHYLVMSCMKEQLYFSENTSQSLGKINKISYRTVLFSSR